MNSIKKTAVNFFKGMLIGIANIIPGVSGGTIAVVLGIFDELIEAVNNFYKSAEQFKKYFFFLLPILFGCVAGIIAFSSLVESALETYSFQTVMFFVGLVFGSIPFIYKKASANGVRISHFIAAAVAAAVVILMSFSGIGEGGAASERYGAAVIIKMFLGGMIASAAMVIPGISGSFVMLLLGIYYDVLRAISSIKDYLRNPSDLELLIEIVKVTVPLGIGIILGILIISKIISVLLERHHSMTYFAILGLVIASVAGILTDPITFRSGVGVVSVICGVITFAVGFAVSALSCLIGERGGAALNR